jgi:Ca-activated chloride channel family protein
MSRRALERASRAESIHKITLVALILAVFAAACTSSQGALVDDGNEAFVQGNYRDALESYRKAEVDAADEPEPYYNTGNALIRQQENEDAARHLQQALKTADPELAADIAFNLGNAHYEVGDFDAAAEAYIESLRFDPGAPDAKHNLELALQRVQEQEQEPDPPQDQEGDQDDPEQGDEEEEDADEGQEDEDGEEGEQGDDQEPPDSAEQEESLTEEQARQLLDALTQDTEALQQRPLFNGREPGRPAQDW